MCVCGVWGWVGWKCGVGGCVCADLRDVCVCVCAIYVLPFGFLWFQLFVVSVTVTDIFIFCLVSQPGHAAGLHLNCQCTACRALFSLYQRFVLYKSLVEPSDHLTSTDWLTSADRLTSTDWLTSTDRLTLNRLTDWLTSTVWLTSALTDWPQWDWSERMAWTENLGKSRPWTFWCCSLEPLWFWFRDGDIWAKRPLWRPFSRRWSSTFSWLDWFWPVPVRLCAESRKACRLGVWVWDSMGY